MSHLPFDIVVNLRQSAVFLSLYSFSKLMARIEKDTYYAVASNVTSSFSSNFISDYTFRAEYYISRGMLHFARDYFLG